MVREIIHVQVGQCGNQVGNAFWEGVCHEHQINSKTGNYEIEKAKESMKAAGKTFGQDANDRITNADVYFQRKAHNKNVWDFIPRGVCVDLEPGTIGEIKSNKREFFKGQNLLNANNGAGNNWAKGHYTEGAELVDNVLDAVRKEMECADSPQGFQLFHSLGGGTGSGMGTLLLLKIRDAYPDKITTTYSCFPSPQVSDTVVEPYNAVLSSHQLLENADETFVIDNEALFNIGKNILGMGGPQSDKKKAFNTLNPLIAKVTLGITSSMRFPGTLNQDLRKLGVNLVPFPRLHFFLVSEAPLKADRKINLNAAELTSQAISQSNYFSNVKPADGKALAVSLTYRGPLKASEVDKEVKKMQTEDRVHSDLFVEWIPNNIKSAIVSQSGSHFVTPKEANVDGYWEESLCSATYLANTTALKGIFQRLATQFGAMYKRKAFLHWYKGEGMDEMEFQEADKNVRDLITEYQDKQDATYAEGSENESGSKEPSV